MVVVYAELTKGLCDVCVQVYVCVCGGGGGGRGKVSQA